MLCVMGQQRCGVLVPLYPSHPRALPHSPLTDSARTDCAGPVGNNNQPGAEQQKTGVMAAAYTALKKSMPQVCC